MSEEVKEFAGEYRETYEDVDLDHLRGSTMKYNAYDITYLTHSGKKTVRSIQAHESIAQRESLDGFAVFWADGKKYGFHLEEKRLITVNKKQNHTVATRDDIVSVKKVNYPSPAPRKGSVETGVEATIYYRSPRSDKMQQVTVQVDSLEGHAVEVTGNEVGTTRRITALSKYERDIKSNVRGKERALGKVARIEFPRGHRFRVDVEGLSTNQLEGIEDQMKRALQSKLNNHVEIDVTLEDTIDW